MFRLLVSVFILSLCPLAWANPMVHSQGTKLVDGKGNVLQLRGVQLEGWLMWNGVMLATGFQSETELRETLTELAGKEAFEEFRRGIYQNFVTEKDIKMIAQRGFNLVRVSLNHESLEKSELVWECLDNLMDWCERHEVYVMITLHAAPGGQSGVFVCDPETPDLWASQSNQDRTVALWKKIARRYSDRQVVMGYDLLNEPGPFWGQQLTGIYHRITEAIREVDAHHLLILEGSHITTDFSMFNKPPQDPNVAYCFHSYNFLSDEIGTELLKELRQLSDDHQVPIINSEFGAHTADWTARSIELFERENVVGWVYWPWKRVVPENKTNPRWMHYGGIPVGPSWLKVNRWFSLPLLHPKPTRQETIAGMRELVKACRAERLVFQKSMEKVLVPQPSPQSHTQQRK